MAVSGRKISEGQGAVSKDSAEYFEHACVPCLSEGSYVEARGFCVECQEYLCKTCLHCHKKTKVSIHHQLIDINKNDQHISTSKKSEVCTETCSTHRNEVIKFFCSKHEELCCVDCMTLTHSTCDLDYIPEKCVGISVSKEFQDTLKNRDQNIKQADAVMKRAEDKNEKKDAWYGDVIKDIVKVRQEINDHLDIIQMKIEEEAKCKGPTDKQEVNIIIEAYKNFTSDMRKLKLSLKEPKEQNKKSDVFIAVKRAKSKLLMQSEEMGVKAVRDKNTKLSFECNEALENILPIDCFGKLTDRITNVNTNRNIQTSPTKQITPPSGKYPFSLFYQKADINIKLKADSRTSFISGCAFVSSDKVILVDCIHFKLQVVNPLTMAVVEEKQSNSYPCDVTVLPGDQIAVTMPDKKEIKILRTTKRLQTFRRIKVQGECRGITYNHDCLYVVCSDSKCVLELDMKGKVKNSIPLKDEKVFSNPRYIEVSQDNKLLYISDYGTDSVVRVTLQGEITDVNNDISVPRGLVIMDDGSLLVCSCKTNSIYRLQADLKQSCKLVSGLNAPWSICCSTQINEVFIGGVCDHLKVFSLQ